MPRLLSNRKPVARPEDLKENRWEYLNLQQAQPNLGLAPESDTGYTLQTDANGKVTYTNTLGKLEFNEQVISSTIPGEDIEITGINTDADIILTPFQTARIAGNLSVEQDAIVDGDFTVRGIPLGTAPLVSNTLYVTPDGNDENDGTAQDSTRACRTISGAVRSPFYQSGTAIKVMAGTYFEDNPIPLKPYTSVVGNDLRTTFVEPLNKDLDLFHVNSGVYIAQMQMRNLRRGSVERYAPGGAGTYTTGAYCCAFPPNLENPIDVYYSPYIQNCTNQSGPWLKDGTMFVPNQTIQIPLAAGTSTWEADQSQIVVSLYTGTISVGMAVNDAANEGYRNAQVLLKKNREFLQRQTIGYVESTYPALVYDQAKCFRDVGYIVDAVAGDARFGGTKRSIEAGLAYWSGNTSLITGEITETVAAISYLKDIALQVITNTTATNLYNTLTNQIIDLNLDNGQVVLTRVNNSFNLITDIITGGEEVAPAPSEDLLGLIYPTGLSPNAVNVASTITEITQLTTNTYLITLNTPTVSPSDNATIYFGYTSTYPYLDEDIPTEWTANDGDRYVDRRLDPTGSGGGALVDGNAPSLRSPIQSFVFDAFTQLTQGGIGIHIINNGYAQLVSVFTIMASQAVIVENGGIASITNSNANFGDTCLTAKGLGKLAFQGFVRNPAFPTNVLNGEFYPLGYWPQKQIMEVFIPSDRDRPHIGQVMEVVAPDTYINYEGERVPYVNEAGYPGYLVATSNTGSITTGSYTIRDIDVSGIAVGHTLYIRDVLGSEVHPETGQPYVTTGTQVLDVNYRSVTLDQPILTGYTEVGNDNYFNLYFCGNAYYTVLSSTIDSSLASTVTNEVTLVPGQETTTSLAVSFAKNLALRIIQNQPITGLTYDQAKCKRDTGLIVDAISLDLFYPTPELSQSNFAGLQYWNQENYIPVISNEITTTTNAVRYIKELATEIVQGLTTGTRYQSTVSQNVAGFPADSATAEIVSNDFEAIIDILVNGVAGVTDKIIPNGVQSTDTEVEKAYNLLTANKSYIQAEAIAFIEETKFNFDRPKCYRDSGLIVDALALDILYPSDADSQTTFAGLQYWNQGGYVDKIDRELTTTTNAINYVKELAQKVVRGITTGTRYQSTVSQNVSLPTATATESDTIGLDFDVIVDILTGGTAGVTDLIVPNSVTASTVTNTVNAYDLLIANRDYIQAEAVAFVESTKTTGFVYDQTLCYRDVGYMIDSVAFDLLHGGNKQAVQSGVYYYSFDGDSTAIPNEVEQTIAAFNFMKSTVQRVVLNQTGFNYQSTVTQNVSLTTATSMEAEILGGFVDKIINIVQNGPSVANAKEPISLTIDNNANVVNAAKILEANRTYIQAEVVAWVNSTQIFEYDRTKCARDVGYMVDSVAFDLLHPGASHPSNKQAIQSAVYYYNYDSTSTSIVGEIPQTIAAYEYIRDLMPYVVKGISTSTYQSYQSQVTDLTPATDAEVTKLQTYLEHIINIIDQGPSVAEIKVPINLSESVDVNEYNAYQLLLANRAFIQEEVIAYINETFDSGPYQTTYTQVFDPTLTGGEDAVNSLGEKFDIISDIIINGAEASPDIVRPRQYVDSNPNILNARKLLEKNRLFIQGETVAFVDSLWPSKFSYDPAKCSRDTGLIVDALAQDLLFDGTSQSNFAGIQYWNQGLTVIPGEQTTTTAAVSYLRDLAVKVINSDTSGYKYFSGYSYDQVKCARDTGLIVDSLAFDLLYQGESQSTFAGLQYWNQGGYTGDIAGELTTTTNAFTYLKSIVDDIVTNTVISVTTGNTSTQVINLSTGTLAAGLTLQADIDVMLDILVSGTEGITDTVVPNGSASTDRGTINSYNILLANKTFLANEVVARIDFLHPSFSYDRTKCRRDVGYVIDSIAFDLLHGGNRQAIMSGVYYYDFDASSTAIPNEIPQTTAAYGYIKTLAKEIVEGRVVATPYQTAVPQIFDVRSGTSAQSAITDANVDLILDIINNGPSVAPTREPISLTASTDTDVIDSFNALIANREFIKAEVIAYLEAEYDAVGTQITGSTTTNAVKSLLQNKFNTIINILENGTDGITDVIVPNGLDPNTDSNITEAYNLLQANKKFLQNEVVAWVDQNHAFTYDSVKCARDTGLIVDAVAFDLLYPTTWNSQSTFAGLQYWNQDGYTGEIERELTTTTNAITYLSSLAQKVVVNNKTGTRYQNTITQTTSTLVASGSEASVIGTRFGEIIDILTNGVIGITDDIIPNGRQSNSTATINAYQLLINNKSYLQAEVVAWVEANRSGAYDREKCYRDSGIIVDSVISDILFPTDGNSQSTFAGLQYWNQNGYTGLIAEELTTTTNAINYVSDLAQQIVRNITTGTRYQSSVAQTTGTAATAVQSVAIDNEFAIITNILTNGTAGVTDLVIANGITASTSIDVVRAYNLLQANKSYIQAEAIAFVDSTKTPGFVYDSTKCSRDVGYMIDSVCFDLLYGGNRQAVQSGVYYYAFNGSSSAIPNDLTETLLAFEHIKEISQQIIQNIPVTRYQSVVSQITSLDVSTAGVATTLGEKYDIITDIIENGPSVAAIKEPISLTKSSSTPVARAAAILKANKAFIQAETIAFIEETIAFKYDQAKCYRDVGYMVDSVAFDLLHGGNKQSIQSGVYYYGYDATSTAINNEIPQTTAAYNRIKEILPNILSSVEIVPSDGNTTKQITYMLPASSTVITQAQSKIDVITNIINNGPSVATTQTSISLIANPDAGRAYDLLMANRDFIKDEIIAYINTEFGGFVYDKAKCFRDVGYMVDSVSFDLLYGGNKQSIQSGVYYYGYNSDSTAIVGEIPQTTSAYNFIENIVSDIVTGTLIENPQQSSVPQVINLRSTYNEDKCFRDTGILVDSFVTDLLYNDNGYTQSNFSGLQYWNQNGYTGEISKEITTTTNAIRYLKQLAKEIVVNDFKNPVIRWQNTVTQVTNLSTATADQAARVGAEFDIIINILTTGTAGVTDLVVANGVESISEDAQAAYDLLIANKEYLQAEVVAYVELNKSTNFVYDKEKCGRDVGYMVDSVAFDILYGGNRQAIQSGVYYYGFSTSSSVISTEIEQTVAAYTRLKEILPSIVTNQTITKSPYNTLTQVTTLSTATVNEGMQLQDMVDLITGIITNGPSAAEAQLPISLTKSTATTVLNASEILLANREFIQEEIICYLNHVHLVGTSVEAELIKGNINLINNIIEYGPDEVLEKLPIDLARSTSRTKINAAKLLNANRNFIRAETIAYINNTYNTGFLYDKTKCKRDTGLIVDSIAFDLLYQGTTESTFAGLQYWNQNGYTGEIERELTTTTNAIRYIKEIVEKIVLNETVEVTTGNSTAQNTSLTTSTQGIATLLTGKVDIILDIIENGTGGVTDIIEPNGPASTATDVTSAVALLQANKQFIRDEVVARIDYDNDQFDYDRTTCSRDVGYIVDSIGFDLLHGGNRQSVASGVYYYGFNAADTAIDDQIPQTTAAYEYIKELTAKIVTGQPVDIIYQTKVPQTSLKVSQVFSANTGTITEVALLETKIDNITNIINNGPGVAPAKEPIGSVASTSTEVVNAFNLLLANRAFIQAEVVAYIDSVFTDAPNYNKDKCFRDTGAIIDAVGYDLVYGGNYNSVNTGNGYFNRKGQYHLVRLEQNVTDPTLFIDGASVRFYQQSYISASGYLFEYVGAGTQYGALPQVGTADPQQSKEVVQLNNGKVFFTSTDQNGDFRIGPTLVISQSTGVLSGRTFQKSLYAEMTPFILVVGA